MLSKILEDPDLSTRDISGIVGVVLWLVSAIGAYLLSHEIAVALLFGLVVGLLTYFLLLILLNTFLYNKLRLVYKFILTTKN